MLTQYQHQHRNRGHTALKSTQIVHTEYTDNSSSTPSKHHHHLRSRHSEAHASTHSTHLAVGPEFLGLEFELELGLEL
jgi:hypothetical protein